jgi:tyrosine-protein kinase Etk/Wzc
MNEQERMELDLPLKADGVVGDSAERERVHFLDLLIVLAKHGKFLTIFVLVFTVLCILVSLVLPFQYTAKTELMPPQQEQSTTAALLGQISPLINNMSGASSLGRNSSDLFLAMLKSRTVADNLLNRFSLRSVYKMKRDTDAREKLGGLTEMSAGKEGVITISVTDRDPTRAAGLANGYVEELRKLTKDIAVTEAGRRRLFFQREMETAQAELVKADQSLGQTQEKTGILQIDSQAKVMLESAATLRAEVAAKEVQIESMRSFATAENPDLVLAQNELAALRAQVAQAFTGQGDKTPTDIAVRKMPHAGLEYIAKLREVKYRESLLEMMTKQYELARVDEAKDSSLVQVLDRAVPPEVRSFPHRSIIVFAGAFVALFTACLLAFIFEAVSSAKKDSQFLVRLDVLKSYLPKALLR